MFNLEKSITEWRKQMLQGGIKSAAVDELESHLRQDVDKQMRAGHDAESAFDFAVAQIGRPVALKEKFARAGETGWEILRKLKSLFGFAGISRPSLLISPEHIFLGLILEGDGVAWRALKNLGIRIEDARRELLAEMRENPGTA